MKNLLRFYLLVAPTMLVFCATTYAQIPNVRSLANFVFFTNTGAISNTGISVINGNIGTGNGAITGFETSTVNGTIYNAGAVTTQATADLLLLFNEINSTVNTNILHAPAFGGGETIFPGIYSVNGAGSVGDTLRLDAQHCPDALFIFKYNGAFTTGAGTVIVLLNDAKANHIFWMANGAVAMAANTDMKGTVIANSSAISLAAGGKLNGRMLSSGGAIAIDGVSAKYASVPAANVSIWNGGIDSIWNRSCNWCGGIPTDTTNVEIPALLNRYPVLSTGTFLSKNIHIETGASLTINGTAIFSLYGAINNTGTLNITDGTLNLAGVNVEVGGNSLYKGIVKNLTISSGATSSISAGVNMLSVKNNVSFLSSNNSFNTNGNLTLLSSDTLTATVTDMTNNGLFSGNSIEGNVSVERFIPALKRWRYLAVNTEATTGSKNTIQDNWMEGATPGVAGAVAGRGTWITAPTFTATPANFDAISITPSIKWLNGNVYTGILNPTTYDIRSHPAYFTYVRGDRGSTPLNGVVSTTILRTFGRLIQGDKITSITASPFYTGTGNPYASAIDLRKLAFSTNDVINIYVWDPKIGGPYGQGAYQLLSRDPKIDAEYAIIPGGGSYGTALTMNTIESGLGFLVQGATTGRTLTYKEIAKTAPENNAYFVAGNQQKISGALWGQQTNGTYLKADGLQVRMFATYLTALDFNDARKFNSGAENIAILREGTLLTLEYRNVPVTEYDTITLHMANMAQKNYRWIFNFANLDKPGRVGKLIDQYLGTETILNLDGVNSINFTVTATTASFAPNRFIIVLREPPILPLKLSVAAKRNDEGKVFVHWKVIDELNILQYQTEKSKNGISFIAFGTPTNPTNNIEGNALYSKQDENNYNSLQYYRIKTVRENLPVQYSEVVAISAIDKKGSVSVYPNPVQGKTIHLFFAGMPREKYEYMVTNNSGQQISNGTINVQEEVNEKSISLTSLIASENYTLTLVNKQGIKTNIALKMAQ